MRGEIDKKRFLKILKAVPEMFTISEAAQILGVSESCVRVRIRQNKIEYIRIGKVYRLLLTYYDIQKYKKRLDEEKWETADDLKPISVSELRKSIKTIKN